MEERAWPQCRQCREGDLVPLSDYGPEGAAVAYKAWACSNPQCGFVVRIQKGEVAYSRAVTLTPK
jgi:hypothetical protein